MTTSKQHLHVQRTTTCKRCRGLGEIRHCHLVNGVWQPGPCPLCKPFNRAPSKVDRELINRLDPIADIGRKMLAFKRTERPITTAEIVKIVQMELSVLPEEFTGITRNKKTVLARMLVSHAARRHTKLSFPEIATAMGRTNHSTVLTAYNRFVAALHANTALDPVERIPNHPEVNTYSQAVEMVDKVIWEYGWQIQRYVA